MKNVMIVGSNRGIGLALVKKYVEAGDNVIALCREASQKLKDISGITIIENAEVTDTAKLGSISSKLKDQKIDILMHVSGIWRDDHLLEDANWNAFTESFEVNSIAPLKTVVMFKKHLARNAKIGLMSSRMGSIKDNSSGGRYAYRMSKAALNTAGKSLSIDLKNEGISVAILHPGFVQTDMTDGKGDMTTVQSANGLKDVMDKLNLENSGSFYHSNGEELPW